MVLLKNKVMKANEAPESYPMQFRDKIDEYLWKEHHILGGCCSSVESLKYSTAREVAEKLTDAFIDKAVEQLKHYLDNGVWIANNVGVREKEVIIEKFINDMKGE